MRRQQIILFFSLFTISAIPLFLSENANLVLARNLSSVLLYPIRVTSKLVEYLNISNVRIEKLEIHVNKLTLENAILRDILDLDTTQLAARDLRLLKASVIGRDPQNINGYLHIDKGTIHGVVKNQPVVSADGFVGKIKNAGTTTSIVETVENRGFAVSAIDINTGIHGVVKSQTNLLFDYVRHTDAIEIGDSLLTSGMSEVFPKGILIGTVQRVSESDDLFFKHVFVAPAVQINRLVSIYIILDEDRTTASGTQ
ncbi:MAG: rod shape-determining protein MreC [bacterium]